MKGVAGEVAELRARDRNEWIPYLDVHSGLPGPRANLALLDAVVEVADAPFAAELLSNGGEYPAMCAAACFGSGADDPQIQVQAHALASDSRWRVREGVAIGLQHLGERHGAALRELTDRWISDHDLLVQRAALVALCEPRLLRTAEAAAAAINACDRATKHLCELPEERRKAPDARTLRQALGYCWSVAVAADPDSGLSAFQALNTTNPDIAWIVTQNTKKKRLAALL